MTANSPFTGKPMKMVFEPDIWKFRGEEYPYVHIAFLDEESGERLTTTESDTACYNQVTNQYRERHGIPYTEEIITLRKRYNISALKMASILGFGANQYRLYEEGEVPNESNGKMIRSASNPKVFLDLVHGTRHQFKEKEYAKICSHLQTIIASSEGYQEELFSLRRLFLTERGIVNGFAPQSTNRIKHLLLYILGRIGDTFQTKMNKILFYIDFLAYREQGMAISGMAYKAIDYGPAPLRWDRMYSAFDEIEQRPCTIHDQESIALTATTQANTSLFSPSEIALIDSVCLKMKDMSAHDISLISHSEPAWQNHLHRPETIPFPDAFTLTNI